MRTDIHKPSTIIPEDYRFVAFDNVKIDSFTDCLILQDNRSVKELHMAMTGGKYSQHLHGGSCYICGASAIWTATFYHEKSNSYIRTGMDCASKLEMSYGDFNGFKKVVVRALEAVAGKKKAKATLESKGLLSCWEIWAGDVLNYEESTIRDIVGKLIQYGSISEAAENYLRVLLGKIANRSVVAAERAAEDALAEDCPIGKVKISGTILSTKIQDSAFGSTLKMLVRDDRGFKVYGTVPANIDAKRGMKIEFHATVLLSETRPDPKFGFFKRPTRASLLTGEENLQLAFA